MNEDDLKRSKDYSGNFENLPKAIEHLDGDIPPMEGESVYMNILDPEVEMKTYSNGNEETKNLVPHPTGSWEECVGYLEKHNKFNPSIPVKGMAVELISESRELGDSLYGVKTILEGE